MSAEYWVVVAAPVLQSESWQLPEGLRMVTIEPGRTAETRWCLIHDDNASEYFEGKSVDLWLTTRWPSDDTPLHDGVLVVHSRHVLEGGEAKP